jgi:hypothetical protein
VFESVVIATRRAIEAYCTIFWTGGRRKRRNPTMTALEATTFHPRCY